MALRIGQQRQQAGEINCVGFTNKLRQTLIVTRSVLDEWVELQKAAADALAAVQQAGMAEQQSRVDQVITHLLTLQLEQGLSVDQSKTKRFTDGNVVLEQKKENIIHQIDQLNKQLLDSELKIQDLKLEHVYQKDRALTARKIKRNVEVSKETTVDDLTRGILNYKYLGLDFEKAGENALR
jgi:hypothetical protein